MMKSCATCIHLFRKCDGECETCGHAVGEGERENGIDNPSGSANHLLHKGGFEAMLEQIRFGGAECKCMVCYDEDSGRHKYYEENKEITAMLGGEE